MAENTEKTEAHDEPLPIWFFVGLILLVNGVLVILGSLFASSHATVLAELKPGLWWGGVITAVGVVFTVIGLRSSGYEKSK